MPVLRFRIPRLLKAISIPGVDLAKLLEVLPKLKCEAAVLDDGETLEVEIDRDRPDMFYLSGLAEAIKLYLGLSKPRKIQVDRVEFEVRVDPPRKRPFIAVAAVEGIEIRDDEDLEELIQFQEKLHLSYGRRKRVAIGFHDLRKLPSKSIEYRYVNVSSRFVPLHIGKEMSIEEVLKETEQGREYGWIARDGDLHPALISGGTIIAIPPVLNSDVTRVEPGTRGLFIDVTGTDLRAVLEILAVIVYALSLSGGRVVGARVLYPDGEIVTPDLSWRRVSVDKGFARDWLGIEIPSGDELAKLLNRMGLELVEEDSDRFVVSVPPHRIDVLHPVDVLEDIAMAIGLDSIEPEYVPTYLVSKPSTLTALRNAVRDAAVGLGYVEVNALTLVPARILETLGFEDFARVENPLQQELNALKPSPLPTLMQVLIESQHRPHPIKVFEVSECVVRNPASPTGWSNRLLLGMAVLGSVVKFEDIHADCFALLRSLGFEPRTRACTKAPSYAIEGRCAEVVVGNEVVGTVCEIHPRVLEALGIEHPVGYIELDVEKLVGVASHGRGGEV